MRKRASLLRVFFDRNVAQSAIDVESGYTVRTFWLVTAQLPQATCLLQFAVPFQIVRRLDPPMTTAEVPS